MSFASHMSSLISSSRATPHDRARRSKNPKSDIFATHNKGTAKRAAADLEESDHHVSKQVHLSSKELGTVDAATLERSKRKMERKVRLYDDMKKGLHLAADSSDEDGDGPKTQSDEYMARLRRREKEGLIDFDRKWADEEKKREDAEGSDKESEDDENASIISYEDEFGRTRHGTRAEAARATREKEAEERGETEQERWRPKRPDHLIYGEAIQTEAFNPDEKVAAQIANLASRRDRSVTPPEQLHYDADSERRTLGTGFYAFSKDEETRKKQMAEMEEKREATIRERNRLKERAKVHQDKMDARRLEIEKLRAKRMVVEQLKAERRSELFMNVLEQQFSAAHPEGEQNDAVDDANSIQP